MPTGCDGGRVVGVGTEGVSLGGATVADGMTVAGDPPTGVAVTGTGDCSAVSPGGAVTIAVKSGGLVGTCAPAVVVAVSIAACVGIGLFPQPLVPLATRLAEMYTFGGW